MKLSILAGLLALGLTTPSLAADRSYDLPPFTAIDIGSGLDADVTVGGAQRVAVTARDAAHLDKLTVEVVDGTLRIVAEQGLFDFLDNSDIDFTITAPELTSAEASGGADIDISGLAGDTVRLRASGGADIDASDIRATTIQVRASGGADIDADGTCSMLVVEASGGADADLEDLACTDADARASGGSDIDLRASGALRAEASGGADISVKGKPATTEIQESGGGGVNLDD